MESIREYSICLGGGVHTNQDIYCTYCNLPDIVTCSTIKKGECSISAVPDPSARQYATHDEISFMDTHGLTIPHGPA